MKPIAWYDPSNGMVSTDRDCPLFTPLGQVWPLYPERTWVGLTDGDMAEIYNQKDWDIHTNWDYERAIEAKLKEKNNA
jgi:hypothetical protein